MHVIQVYECISLPCWFIHILWFCTMSYMDTSIIWNCCLLIWLDACSAWFYTLKFKGCWTNFSLSGYSLSETYLYSSFYPRSSLHIHLSKNRSSLLSLKEPFYCYTAIFHEHTFVWFVPLVGHMVTRIFPFIKLLRYLTIHLYFDIHSAISSSTPPSLLNLLPTHLNFCYHTFFYPSDHNFWR